MWWILAAKAAAGILQGQAQNSITKINNELADVKATAENKTRLVGARKVAAEGSLARFTQAMNNQRIMESGGSALGAAVVNYGRHKDDATRLSVSDQLQQAEQAGAMAAAQAASGTAGTAGDMVAGATAIRNSMVAQSIADKEGMADYDQSHRAESIMRQMVSGLDSSTIYDALDYSESVARHTAKTTLLGSALEGLGFSGAKAAVGGASDLAKTGYDWFRRQGPSMSTFKMDTSNYTNDGYLGGI
jgi:hypothetical protein